MTIRGSVTGRAWEWSALFALGCMSIAVFFLFDALPFMDLPAHAGLFALRHRFAASPFEQKYYVLAPHVGAYFVFRLLGEILSRALGPLLSIRLLAAGAMIALPLAILDARRRLYESVSPGFGFLGFAFGFGLITLFGFASYLLGVALLVECTAIWLTLERHAGAVATGERRHEIVLALLAILLFLTHGFAFVLFVAIVAITTLASHRSRSTLFRLRVLAPAMCVAAWSAWLERASSVPAGSAPVPQPRAGVLLQSFGDKLSLLATPTLMTRTGIDVAVGVVVWIVVVAGVVATVQWMRHLDPQQARGIPYAVHARALLACCLAFGVIFVILPHEIGWFGFVDGRVLPVVLVLASVCVPPNAIGPRLAFAHERLIPLAACVLVGLSLYASRTFQREARGYREVFAHVPALSRVLNLPLDPNSDIFTAHPFVHYDKLMLVDRPMLLSDIWLHQGSALFPRPDNPVLGLPPSYLSSDIHEIDWARFNLADWNYVLVRTKADRHALAVPETLAIVDHVGGWWLYKTTRTSEVMGP